MNQVHTDFAALRLSTVLVVAVVALAGCQKATDVGALNRCGETVEADVVSKKELADENPAWSTLDPDERESVRAVPEHADSVYMMVRRPSSEQIVHKTIAMSDLADPPDDVDYEKEVVLSGDLCPR